jgi:hypothetical protein
MANNRPAKSKLTGLQKISNRFYPKNSLQIIKMETINFINSKKFKKSSKKIHGYFNSDSQELISIVKILPSIDSILIFEQYLNDNDGLYSYCSLIVLEMLVSGKKNNQVPSIEYLLNEIKKLDTFSKIDFLYECRCKGAETMNVAFNKIDAIALFNRNEIDYFKELLEGGPTNFEDKLNRYCNATDNEKEALKEPLALSTDFVTILLDNHKLMSSINSNQIETTFFACCLSDKLYKAIIDYPENWCDLNLDQHHEIISLKNNLKGFYNELNQLLLSSSESNIFESLIIYLKSTEYNNAKELNSIKLIQLGFNADALENHTNFLLNNDFPFYTDEFIELFNKLATTNNTEFQKTKEILLEKHSKAGLLQSAIIKNAVFENEANQQVIENTDLFNNIVGFIFPNNKRVNDDFQDESPTEESITDEVRNQIGV